MASHIALLRAVNVGGRSLKMGDLAAFARDLGLGEPRTLLQSGNLVFESPAKGDAALEKRLETEAKKRFGFAIDVMVRSAAEWQALMTANPFADAASDDPAHLLVMPLKTAPAKDALERLRAAIKGRELVELAGRDAYLVYPDGVGNSKLTIGVIEKALGVRGTARNWNTVLKLAEMVAA
ncbi:MAG TPA: DUF1697 domain-containing protein [Caulobacteraceae bacterium]|jgi:uncharacterized protein (DUF1697 family)|nr:DUF1697 domain-containing protein [Caulobacteraceae bacterium]